MFSISSAEISVPIETSAADFKADSSSSGRIDERSQSAQFVRTPIIFTVFAKARLSTINFAISGKCQPYHSFARMAYVFNSLSRSSRSAMA